MRCLPKNDIKKAFNLFLLSKYLICRNTFFVQSMQVFAVNCMLLLVMNFIERCSVRLVCFITEYAFKLFFCFIFFFFTRKLQLKFELCLDVLILTKSFDPNILAFVLFLILDHYLKQNRIANCFM